MNVNDFKMTYDHHTHTTYSHGTGTILDNVKAACEKGLRSIAITDHGPAHLGFPIKRRDIPSMKRDIEEARKLFPDMEILLGCEFNSRRKWPYLDWDLRNENDEKTWDIKLAGYHYGTLGSSMISNLIWDHAHPNGLLYHDYDGVPQAEISALLVKNTMMICDMLNYSWEIGQAIDILAHPGDKGPFDIYDIAKMCEKTGTMLEVNGKHPHLSVRELMVAKRFDVRFVIGSDAHTPSQVGTYLPQLERLFEAGIEPERIDNIERVR